MVLVDVLHAQSIGVSAANVGVRLTTAEPAVASIVTVIVPLEQAMVETAPATFVFVPSHKPAEAAVADRKSVV